MQKLEKPVQQRMKQQHEREWGNTHACLSSAAVAAAAAVVWGWAAISRLLILPAVTHSLSLCAAQVFLLSEGGGDRVAGTFLSRSWSQLLSAWYDGEGREGRKRRRRGDTPRRARQLVTNWLLAEKTCGECDAFTGGAARIITAK